MKLLCELTDQTVLGLPGRSDAPPRYTARAILRREDGLYAVMYAARFNLYTLPGGGMEPHEDPLTALRREMMEETGCACDRIDELGMVLENRAHCNYTQCSYYYLVTTASPAADTHLTAAECHNGTEVQWHALEDAVRLIAETPVETNQQRFLQARDAAALRAYLETCESDEPASP